jgi:hypothetical protein
MQLGLAVLAALTLASAPSALCQEYDYAEALAQSLLFYEAQRSGPLPADNRIDWRDDSAVDDLIPGGYYDGKHHYDSLFSHSSFISFRFMGNNILYSKLGVGTPVIHT